MLPGPSNPSIMLGCQLRQRCVSRTPNHGCRSLTSSPFKVKLASNEGTTNTAFEIQPYVLSAPAPAGASMAQHATAHSVPLSRGRHRLSISGDVIRDQLASGRFNAKPTPSAPKKLLGSKLFRMFTPSLRIRDLATSILHLRRSGLS